MKEVPDGFGYFLFVDCEGYLVWDLINVGMLKVV